MKRRFIILGVTLLFLIGFDLAIGEVWVNPLNLFQLSDFDRLILIEFRLPRLLAVLIGGIALSLSGYILQKVSVNPMVDSSILGINAGAAFGLVLSFVLSAWLAVPFAQALTYPFWAILGAGLGFLSLYFLALRRSFSGVKLILTGVAITAVFQALMTLLQLLLNSFDFQAVVPFLTGDVWNVSYDLLLLLLLLLGVLILIFSRFLSRLRLIEMGKDMAISLGVNYDREVKKLVILSVVFAGVGVASVGSLGFIGIISSRIAQSLVPFRLKAQLVMLAIVASYLMVISDLVSKMLLFPTTLPLGLVTSVIGAPYFIYLVLKN